MNEEWKYRVCGMVGIFAVSKDSSIQDLAVSRLADGGVEKC